MARFRKLIAGFVAVATAGVVALLLTLNASSSAAAQHPSHRVTTPSVTTTTTIPSAPVATVGHSGFVRF